MCSYSNGCRCDKCREDQRLRMQRYAAERKERDPGWYVGRSKTAPGKRECSICQESLQGGGLKRDVVAHKACAYRRKIRRKRITRRTYSPAVFGTSVWTQGHCDGCGQSFCRRSTEPVTYCNARCKQRAERTAVAKPTTFKQCTWCNALHLGTGKACGPECSLALQRQGGNSSNATAKIRNALAGGDLELLKVALLERCEVVGECWVYTKLNRDGYPIIGNNTGLHRMVLEVKHQARLGSQHAHHTCGRSACVNPDHLQPVTHRENMAEMLTRKSLVSRIRELEDALTIAAPDHPLLAVVRVA